MECGLRRQAILRQARFLAGGAGRRARRKPLRLALDLNDSDLITIRSGLLWQKACAVARRSLVADAGRRAQPSTFGA